jgi:hypothetical protein
MATARCTFLAFDLPRLRDAFDVRAGEGVRLPEIATAQPAFELRLAGTLNSVTGELMCTTAIARRSKHWPTRRINSSFAIHKIPIEC